MQKQISSHTITFSIWIVFLLLIHAHVIHILIDNNWTNGPVHFSADTNNTSVASTPEDMMLGKSCKLETLQEEAGSHYLKDFSHTLNPSSNLSTGGELGSLPVSSTGQKSLISSVMENARHRFDNFWANQKNGDT